MSAASEASQWGCSIFKFRHVTKANERRPETSVTRLPDAEPSSQTPSNICVLQLSRRNCRGIQIIGHNKHNTGFFFWPGLSQQVGDLVLDLHIFPAPVDPNCLGMWKDMSGAYAGIIFQKILYIYIYIYIFFFNIFEFINTFFWKYDDVLIPFWPPFPHKTATNLMNGTFIIHWFPLISHEVAQLDLPCHQFVSWTHLRLRQ